MRFGRSLSFLLAGCSLAIPSFSNAHFLWVTLSPAKAVSIALQEAPTDDPLPLAEKSASLKAMSKSGPLHLKADGDWLTSETKDECVGASLDYGVLDKTAEKRGIFWLQYFAKAASSEEASRTRLGLAVELTMLTRADGKRVVTVIWHGKPAAGAEVTVVGTSNKEGLKWTSGPDGRVVLPESKGPIAIRALVNEQVPGTHDGKPYELIRSYSTLNIGAGTVQTTKRFTQVLRDSFGDNHDVVGRTAFNRTLMAGKLTKAQGEAHFQQRALVHEAVDKILSGKSPYGAAQQELLPLLKNDLQAMGSKWPTQDMAWPLTQDFVRTIRESGPYFALGVFHVYYGGITHGGRDIGSKIAETLGTPQTYYLKSDGYADYAEQVDAIADEAARKDMVKGGQAAYKYIIAVSDLDVFRSN